MKICLDFGFIEDFGKMPIKFGWSTYEETHTRVRPKCDVEGFGKMGIHCLVRTSINRLTVYLRVSNEVWKCEFPEIGLGKNKRKWHRKFPQISNVSRVGCFVGFKFDNFKFQILVLIKLHTFLLTWTSMATDRETLKNNFGNAYVNSI